METEKSDLIEATYKLVLQTSTYGDFLAAWEHNRVVSEQGLAKGKVAQGSLSDNFIRLLDQAIKVIEEVKKIDPSEEQFISLSNSAATPTAIVSPRGIILSVTDGFLDIIGLRTGDRIEDLNLSPAEVTRLHQGLHEIGRAPQSKLLAMVKVNLAGDARTGLLSLVAASHESALLSLSVPKFTAALGTVAADLFELSDTEVAVLGMIIEGLETQEIAVIRSRSIETVRSQLKSILRKVGAHSQAELVGIFSTIPKFLALSQGQPGEEEPMEQSLRRSDGRLVSFTVLGPASGHAVILFHGMIDGAILPVSIMDQFVGAGLRLIVPARPGFGKSEGVDDPETALTRVAEDCCAILDQLKIKQCLLVGQLGGAVYAAATANLLGDRAQGVVNIGGTIPFVSDNQFQAMTRGQRVLAKTYVKAPALAVFVLRAGIALVRKGQEIRLLDAQFPKSSPDYEVLHQPETYEAIRQGYHFAFDRGHKAHYIDALGILSDWSAVADKVKQPVICLHGEADPVTPIRFVRAFVDGANNRSLVAFPLRGQLILYAEPGAVIAALLQLLMTSSEA